MIESAMYIESSDLYYRVCEARSMALACCLEQCLCRIETLASHIDTTKLLQRIMLTNFVALDKGNDLPLRPVVAA